MKLSIDRENLLPCLQQLSGVIDRKQTLPILSNILIKADENENTLCLTSTDTEIQIITGTHANIEEGGEITVPAKKLLDICRLSNKGNLLSCHEKDAKFIISAGKSRFSLTTLPAEHYPPFDYHNYQPFFKIKATDFKKLLDKTVFCIALQDVRFFLNGLMLTVEGTQLMATATDGHRLAVYTAPLEISSVANVKIIIPRKAILELNRLLDMGEEYIDFQLSENAVKISYHNFEFSSKLIEGKLPDYRKSIPINLEKSLLVDHDSFKNALSRIAVLTDEDYRGINFDIEPKCLTISLRNPEHEEGEEKLVIDYKGENLSLGFNVTYIQDAIAHIDSERVKFSFTDDIQGCLFEDPDNPKCIFVIMPMHL